MKKVILIAVALLGALTVSSCGSGYQPLSEEEWKKQQK